MSAGFPHHLLWLAAAAPLMAGVELGRRILGNNDNARFAVLGQDVLAHGLRMFPELNGAPYYNKPALLAWLIALVSWPAGSVSQLTAALPSAAAAVALAFVVWALGRDMFGADAGRYAALVAVATQGFFLQARLPLPDMLMTLFITLALWQLRLQTQDGARSHHWVGFYGATALAFWAKGGAGFLPLAVALGWVLVNGRDASWRRLRLLRGLALLVLLVAPWWLFGLQTDRVALHGAVVGNQFFWYLPSALTLSSVAAPLRNAFGVLFPWVLVVPLVLVHAVRCARGEDAERRDVRALLAWAAVTFVMVGVSREQRLRYYLPLVPPAALLIGWWLARALPERRDAARVPWRLYGGIALVLAAVTAAALLGEGRRSQDLAMSLPASLGEALVLGGGLGAMLLALVWGMRRARNDAVRTWGRPPAAGTGLERSIVGRAFAVAWLGGAVFVAGSYHWEVDRFNAANDFPRVSERMGPVLQGASVVATWGVPELPLAFYFGRRVVRVETIDDLERVMSGGAPAVAIMTDGVLAGNRDRERLEVLMQERFTLQSISLVRRELANRL
jgi:4-amino-4-deoxy-L-arabinose transferase-like glycosyltransferase